MPNGPRRLLGLALTSRDKGADAVPMAGFPHPGPRLLPGQDRPGRPARGGLRAGRRRATGQGAGQARRRPDRHARNPDRRRAARSQDGQLSGGGRRGGPKLGLAWVELSTGRFSLTGLLRTELIDEIARLNPAEILISELSVDAPWARVLRGQSAASITVRPSWDFQPEQARKTLFDQFGTTTLAGFGIDDRGIEVQAAGALMAYLRETQKSSLGHIARLIPYRRADTLALDEMTRRSLELVRTFREGKREGSLLSRDRLLGDADGGAAAVRMADVAR